MSLQQAASVVTSLPRRTLWHAHGMQALAERPRPEFRGDPQRDTVQLDAPENAAVFLGPTERRVNVTTMGINGRWCAFLPLEKKNAVEEKTLYVPEALLKKMQKNTAYTVKYARNVLCEAEVKGVTKTARGPLVTYNPDTNELTAILKSGDTVRFALPRKALDELTGGLTPRLPTFMVSGTLEIPSTEIVSRGRYMAYGLPRLLMPGIN